VVPDDEEFIIFAIEVDDTATFGDACSQRVSAVIPSAVEAVSTELQTLS
jgi:hypothetical protein